MVPTGYPETPGRRVTSDRLHVPEGVEVERLRMRAGFRVFEHSGFTPCRAGDIPSEVAIDAIEEIFVMMRSWGPPAGGHVGQGEVLEFVAIDSGARPTIVLAPGGPHLTGDPISPDLSLVGAASDLSLMMLKRPPVGRR